MIKNLEMVEDHDDDEEGEKNTEGKEEKGAKRTLDDEDKDIFETDQKPPKSHQENGWPGQRKTNEQSAVM